MKPKIGYAVVKPTTGNIVAAIDEGWLVYAIYPRKRDAEKVALNSWCKVVRVTIDRAP